MRDDWVYDRILELRMANDSEFTPHGLAKAFLDGKHLACHEIKFLAESVLRLTEESNRLEKTCDEQHKELGEWMKRFEQEPKLGDVKHQKPYLLAKHSVERWCEDEARRANEGQCLGQTPNEILFAKEIMTLTEFIDSGGISFHNRYCKDGELLSYRNKEIKELKEVLGHSRAACAKNAEQLIVCAQAMKEAEPIITAMNQYEGHWWDAAKKWLEKYASK